MSELASIESVSTGSSPQDEGEHELEEFLKPLVLDEPNLHTLAYQFSNVYKDLAQRSDEQFLPTPVTSLPTGEETGQFLAIDVGGTNLRVAFIELLGEAADDRGCPPNGTERSRETIKKAQRARVRRTLEKAWPIGEHLKMDKAEDLFSWIGDCIAEVVSDRLSSDTYKMEIPAELVMGITFSFPMIQETLSAATLMPMGKGFAITSDLNLAPLLLAGYARHTRRQSSLDTSPRSKRRRLGPLPILKIAAITNDTVATLASLAYSVKSLPNSRVAAGIIVGTGCNATIPMKLTDLAESKAKGIVARDPKATETVVNTEITISGACGPLEYLTTKWDRQLDAACARPGFQPLEYMTGGRYVGELVRTIFFDYMTTAHNPPIPSSSLPATTVHSYSFSTTFVSAVIARARSDGELAGELKRRIPPPESSNWAWSPHSAGALRKIANLVQIRSAGLIAAATIGLLATVGEIALSDPSASSSSSSPSSSASSPSASRQAENKVAEKDLNKEKEKEKKKEKTEVNGKTQSPMIKAVPPELAHRQSRDGLSPAPGVTAWHSGPEELVIAYTGGIIQHYPNFKEQCQRFIDRLVMRAGPQDGGKSVFLREARDGGIIGAGVLAGMETARIGRVHG